MGKISYNTSEVVDDPTKIILEKVLQRRQDISVTMPEIRRTLKYIFIDLKNEQYGSDASRIVEITYNDAMLEKAYGGHVQSQLFITILALAIGICAAILLSRFLLKPISIIVGDVNRISEVNLTGRSQQPM